MMTPIKYALRPVVCLAALFAILLFGTTIPTLAQTAGGTVISNQASATYQDGSATNYSTVSNTVTVTVSNVSGLAITPDAGSVPTFVPGQTGVLYTFTVRNTGNFADQVRFLTGGASIQLAGTAPATITRAVIDVDNSNSINGGDTDIKANGADVLSASIAANATISVLVEVSVGGAATAGQTIQVILGDASTGGPTFDNQPQATSAHEVRTVSALSVNGLRAAKGDITGAVAADAALSVTINAPAGPVALGSNITLTGAVTNTGSRTATAETLTNGPAGSNTGVFLIYTVPTGTQVATGQTFPVGTLYSVSPISQNAVTTATWTTTQPALTSITRVAFNTGSTLGVGLTTATETLIVTVQSSINASNALSERDDAYAQNSLAASITATASAATTLTQVGNVLVGPSGQPAATGPTNNNDDYTNKSQSAGISGVAPGGVTTAGSGGIVYTNTVQNTGNADDTMVLSAPTVPAGFTVEISINGGTSYTTVSGGGTVSLALAFGNSANILVRVTAPSGKTVLTGYDTVILATSTVTAAASNATIDRLYTGFVSLSKTATVANGTGVGGLTDPVPGAVITYSITYSNLSSTGGANNVQLTATNLVITEDGSVAPNNWDTTTTNNGTPTDSGSGTVVTVNPGKYTDTIGTLAAGSSGTFTFKRTIN
jgi:hypothetical protein